MDALMLEADVSTLKWLQHSGVCGGAGPPSACAAAAVVPAATVWLRCSNDAAVWRKSC